MTTASCYSFCNVLLKDGFKVRCLDGVPVCCMFFITCCLACVVSGQWSVSGVSVGTRTSSECTYPARR
jgi:hypothetical protein